MNSTEFWDEKKKEFEVRIINNPFICHKDLNNLEKVILRKFHGRRLNNAKEELGITKIRYSSMPKKVLDERIFNYPATPHPNGEYYITSSLAQFIKEHDVFVERAAVWIPIGNSEDLARANEHFKALAGKV